MHCFALLGKKKADDHPALIVLGVIGMGCAWRVSGPYSKKDRARREAGRVAARN